MSNIEEQMDLGEVDTSSAETELNGSENDAKEIDIYEDSSSMESSDDSSLSEACALAHPKKKYKESGASIEIGSDDVPIEPICISDDNDSEAVPFEPNIRHRNGEIMVDIVNTSTSESTFTFCLFINDSGTSSGSLRDMPTECYSSDDSYNEVTIVPEEDDNDNNM